VSKQVIMQIGAQLQKGFCSFVVWASLREKVDVKIVSPEERIVPMEMDERGYWRVEVSGILPGARYLYRLDNGKGRPDPASRFQPEGVHGPSQVVDHASFSWEDAGWTGLSLQDYILYELHAGTFTQEGTFDAIITRLDYLKETGITAIELMPVAQFPGARNWGYDGVYPYAVHNSYGGPDGLKRLVNACHRMGLAVVLDVVYNHLGPEGNYLWDYGPYFTDKYKTPWGDAVNFDGPYCDEVRGYFIESALAWVTDYHIDALRIDAIHGIFDFSAKHFLQELGEAVHARAEELGRKVQVIPESDLNDVRVINPVEFGGHGLDAQWNDDFHHALHTLITGERKGYYCDFGRLEHLEKAFREGFVYSGQYSEFRKRRHGSSSKDRPARQFVVFSQNHDQVGNRMKGERLSSMVSFEQLKLAAGVVLLSPFIPLLFMGEEYGETAPFQYFVSHSDEALRGAIRKGRKEEFASFGWKGDVPDPGAESAFLNSHIDPGLRRTGRHKSLFAYYAMLLKLRRSLPALSSLSKENTDAKGYEEERVLQVRRRHGDSDCIIFYAFSDQPIALTVVVPAGAWVKVLDSSSPAWGGTGKRAARTIVSLGEDIVLHLDPHSVVLYELSGKEP
jgi:maltooligosyltrehalose trehalohydrolase